MNETQKMLIEDLKRLQQKFPEFNMDQLIQIQQNEIIFDGMYDIAKKVENLKTER